MEKLTFEDGSIYEVEILDSKPHGKGKLTLADGSLKEGIWKNGKFLGE